MSLLGFPFGGKNTGAGIPFPVSAEVIQKLPEFFPFPGTHIAARGVLPSVKTQRFFRTAIRAPLMLGVKEPNVDATCLEDSPAHWKAKNPASSNP